MNGPTWPVPVVRRPDDVLLGEAFDALIPELDRFVTAVPERADQVRIMGLFGALAVAVEGLRHQHVDAGGRFCPCGAQRCSLPSCDAACVHRGGWLSAPEVQQVRREQVLRAVIDLPGPTPDDVQRSLSQ